MSLLCFICNSAASAEINMKSHEQYSDIVGTDMNPDSQLCYICCYLLNKLSIFKSICLKRNLEYPIISSEKSLMNLQQRDTEMHVLCPDKCITQNCNSKSSEFDYNDGSNDDVTDYNDTQYVESECDELCDKNLCEYRNETEHLDYDDNVTNINSEENNYIEVKIEDADNLENNCDLHKNLTTNKLITEDNINCIDKAYNNDIQHENQIESHNETNENELNIYNNRDIIENANNTKSNREKRDEIIDSKVKKKKANKSNRCYKRIILNLEKQKAELEANRKKKKYLEAEFKCYSCALGFLFKDSYRAHMMRHEESNGEFQCTTCTLRFASLSSLRVHALTHSERHQCRKCGESLKPRAKRRHLCFGPNEPQSVACHLCGNLLKDANGLQQHLKRVHMNRASGRRYACNICGESYPRQGPLRAHMIKHINRKFQCDQCPRTYSSPYTLTQHKKMHQGDGTMHYCHTCGAGYATRKSLLAHMRNTTNHQTTTFECPICSRVCPNQKAMASHIQSVHSTTKDYGCELCPARYTNRKSLVRHVGTHTKKKEVKMVVCHLCGANFKGNGNLNRHLRQVCNKTEDKEEETTEELVYHQI